MSKMKKLFAMLLTLVMIMALGTTTMAKELKNAEPSPADVGTVTINGVTGNPTVTLYKVAKANYDTDNLGFVGYTWAEGVDFSFNETTKKYEPTADEITSVANKLVASKTIIPLEAAIVENVAGNTYTKDVNVGAYIAVITGANDGSVYNPVFLTVSYNKDGSITEGTVNLPVTYTYGTTAVAKKTTPDIEKEITNGTVGDDTNDDGTNDIHTAGLGSKVDFKITPTMPSYPANANNKTFFVADTMSSGLTFDFATLNVEVNGNPLTKADAEYKDKEEKTYSVVEFKSGDIVYAVGYNTNNGFNLNFNYETLIYSNGSVYAPVITYSAIVNKDAVVGNQGNPNNATLYYTNTPNSGVDWDDPVKKPDEADGIKEKHDQEIVYTYQLAFLKTGEDDADEDSKPDGLAGAIFGIYDENGNLVDKVTTNANGYAVSTNVKKGTYKVKELLAPAGYSLNTKEYAIDATWTTALFTDTGTVTDFLYTTDEKEAMDTTQVGWIVDGKFYEKDEFTEATNTVKAAYIKTTTTTSSSSSTMQKNIAGSGTVKLEDAIPNTKLVSLPSTGGIGTTIFTIGGCAIMIAAAFFFFVSRRKDA